VSHTRVLLRAVRQIDRHLRKLCDVDFTVGKLDRAEVWLRGAVVPWITVVLQHDGDRAAAAVGARGPGSLVTQPAIAGDGLDWEPIDDGSGGESRCSDAVYVGDDSMDLSQDQCGVWEHRVEFHLFEVWTLSVFIVDTAPVGRRSCGDAVVTLTQSICRLRIAQLFDIIRDYPDSIPVLHDLKACLQRTQLVGGPARCPSSFLMCSLMSPSCLPRLSPISPSSLVSPASLYCNRFPAPFASPAARQRLAGAWFMTAAAAAVVIAARLWWLQHKVLCTSLVAAFQTRLLHPGATTAQILELFVSSIRVSNYFGHVPACEVASSLTLRCEWCAVPAPVGSVGPAV
jgi:hypothetical protein